MATKVYVLWGDTQTGKTFRIRRDFPECYFYNVGIDMDDNMQHAIRVGARCICFDDCAGRYNTAIDCHSFNLVVASRRFDKVFITGTLMPELWWNVRTNHDEMRKFLFSITRVWNTYDINQVLHEWPPQ